MILDPWQVATGCITLLTALLAWIGQHHIARIDGQDSRLNSHESRLTMVEANGLTRETLRVELTSMEKRLMDAFAAQHTYVAERIGRIEQSVDKAHERVDEMQKRAV